MRNITILGAGKSSIALIDYLVEHAPTQEWEICVADLTEELALHKTKSRVHTRAAALDVHNETSRRELISASDIVISMLPAAFHITIAYDCLALKKHLITPSYISDAMQQLNKDVSGSGLVFMNEIGLDPGIDHMSAMQIIERLRGENAHITSFKSHCGGLIAPESDDNPWHYKFTWNPRNVVLAGQGAGGIKYRRNGELRELSYQQLFASAEKIVMDGFGAYESYPNRDSLKYVEAYGLHEVETMYRGTLRVPPFCAGWNCLIQLGLTRDADTPVLPMYKNKAEILHFLQIAETSQEYALLNSIDLFQNLAAISSPTFNPAKFLQEILEHRWQIKPGDRDLVVMIHEFEYWHEGKGKKLQSSLVITGKDEEHTAMSITVGLPVAMAAKMILNRGVKERGVLMPVFADIYNPILAELKEHGLSFTEKMPG